MNRQPFLTPSLPLFHQLNFLKSSDTFKLEVTELILIAGESLDKPQFHSIKPVTAQHNYNTRHSVKNNYILPQTKTNFGKQLLQYIGPRLWKEVPSKLKTLPLKSSKKHLLSCYAD